MAVFRDWQGRRCMMQFFILKLLVWLGLLCNIALAQLELSENLTGFVSFPDVVITCIGNAAIFITSLLVGRLDLEMGARDALATIGGPKLADMNGLGLTTCRIGDASIVMLSNPNPNSSIRQFMKYISKAYNVHSILLPCLTNSEFARVAGEICICRGSCRCIVFRTVEQITIMIACRMPGTLKRLSDSLCLLPSLSCLRNGCHGCNQGLLHVEGQRLTERESMVGSPAAIYQMPNFFEESPILNEHNCICIPVHEAENDVWTKMLIRSLKSKDKEDREIRIMASDDLENYIAQRGKCSARVKYSTASLILPRITEVLVNLLLTFWFRVDGFSSSLVARRAIRDHLVDSKGSGFAANAFLTEVRVNSNATNTHVCQVLTFRGNRLNLRTLSFIVGSVNMICSISWALLIAFEGGAGKWYDTKSMPPSKATVAVIMAAIIIALGLDCLHVYLNAISDGLSWRKNPMIWTVIVLEIAFIVSGSAMAGFWDVKAFGHKGFWVYSALQGLVWVKWGVGSCLLGEYSQEFGFSESSVELGSRQLWCTDRGGVLVYSSSFLLNAILAGVRGKWEYSPTS